MLKQKLTELGKVLNIRISSFDELKGGSGGKVVLLHSDDHKFVYKKDTPTLISAQTLFYRQYRDLPFLSKLLYESPDNTELVISYCEPTKSKEYDKTKLLINLVKEFISNYSLYDQREFGFMSEFITGASFAQFLCKQAIDAAHYLDGILTQDDLSQVIDLIHKVYSTEEFTKKYLLHGDFGFHNFFYTNETITGIIDPDPIIGHPLYDLLFAFCSNPRDITVANLKILLEELSKIFQIDLKNAKSYLKIALYKRISSCKKHHPDDLPEYLKIWNQL